MDHIIVMIDVLHEDDDGIVTELDVVQAAEEVIAALKNSFDERQGNTEPLISMSIAIGEDPKKHGNILIGSARILSAVAHATESYLHMKETQSVGPMLGQIIQQIVGGNIDGIHIDGVETIQHARDENGVWVRKDDGQQSFFQFDEDDEEDDEE